MLTPPRLTQPLRVLNWHITIDQEVRLKRKWRKKDRDMLIWYESYDHPLLWIEWTEIPIRVILYSKTIRKHLRNLC